MMGRGHMGTGLATSSYLVYSGLEPIVMGILAATIFIGSVFPDRMEKIGPIRILAHRGLSHWILGWVAVFSGSFYYVNANPDQIWVWGIVGLSFGSLVHIMGDVPNYQKVPLFSLKPSFSLGLWKSGKNDFAIILALLLPHLYLGRGFLANVS